MNYYPTLALMLWLYMSTWFVISLARKRNDVADVAWGLGFVLLAWASFFLSEVRGTRGLLVNILVTAWGVRLAWHIYTRNRGKAEDYRYLAWRHEWGKWFYTRSYLQVYLLQGLLLLIISLPVVMINRSAHGALGFVDGIGVCVWVLGFAFETVADAELARFARDPRNRGKIMQSGLWRYTRHPNYFGEIVQWWGIWVLSLVVKGGCLAIIGPITITFLILKVSGVPILEKKMAENPAFADYKWKTSVLLPWFPRA